MKDARIISKHRPGSTMLELREGRDGIGGIIYKAVVASGSGAERPKLIDRLREVAGERKIERLFLAPLGSSEISSAEDAEYRLCFGCGKYWKVTKSHRGDHQNCERCTES